MRYLITLIIVIGIAALFAPPSSADLDAWNNGQNANITVSNITVKGTITPSIFTNSLTTDIGVQINGFSSQTNDLQRWANGGTNLLGISNLGAIRATNGSAANPSYSFGSKTNQGIYYDGTYGTILSGGGTPGLSLNASSSQICMANALNFGWISTSGATAANVTDTYFTVYPNVSGEIHLYQRQTTQPSARGLFGGDANNGFNIAGGRMNVGGGRSTGTNVGGPFVIQVSPAGAVSNATQNAFVDAVTVDSTKTVTMAGALFTSSTVAMVEGKMSSTDSVDLNTATKTTLFTVPAGKTLVVTKIIVRNASSSLTTASFSFGYNANADDVVATATHTELTGNTLYTKIEPKVGAIIGNAADVFGVKCTILQGSAATVTISVFGYFF